MLPIIFTDLFNYFNEFNKKNPLKSLNLHKISIKNELLNDMKMQKFQLIIKIYYLSYINAKVLGIM